MGLDAWEVSHCPTWEFGGVSGVDRVAQNFFFSFLVMASAEKLGKDVSSFLNFFYNFISSPTIAATRS